MLIYQNYHRHSHLTNVRISDSAVTNDAYVRRAVELGHGILSSCEHGWQGRYNETVNLAKENGLKPLISAEAYWVKDREEKDRTNCHIFIAAMNENGRKALNDVLSEANLTGFYGQPRLDIPLLLSLPKNDVIVTTACIGYWRYDDIEEITEALYNHFGDNFYLEVQYHNTPAQIDLNQRILKLRKKIGAKLIMGCDSHYIYPEQAQTRVDFLVSKGLTYPEEEGWFMDYPDGDTAYQRFANQCVLSHEEILEAINNTNVFLNVEEYNSPVFNDEIKLPSLHPEWTQEQKNEKYKSLVWQGWETYKANVPEEKWPKYIAEIESEMQVVIDTNMADYFIIDYEVMKRGKELGGKLTKSARGSGASFFTNTLLGFSDVDRISSTVHMFPERFMSTTRILESKGIPDIDMDEAPTAPFVQAQAEILGQEHSYPMIAYGTMRAPAAWKLYAKSQGVPFEIANAVSEQIKRYELAVKHADEDEKDDVEIGKFISREYKDVYDKSAEYLSLITSWSIAPCSSLIYQGDIRREIGLVKIKDNICCLMDGKWGESGHFLKNDHLKVSVVELIYKTYESIGQEPPPVKMLLAMCTPKDEAWSIYEKGCCLGINQVEKESTAARAGKYKPKNIAELTAFVAAIRPGFASQYKKFENREHFSFGIESLDGVLQTPEMQESWLLYQESIMAVLNYAGIPMSECYTAIKNIAKKRADKVLAYQQQFRDGMATRLTAEGYDEEKIKETCDLVWKAVEDAASYSYNASHAYCVALNSLYCAWLKAHHPLAFYETYIKIMEEKGDKNKINAAKEEAESYFGIRFVPMRFGQDNRSIHADEENNEMINTMGSIKGYGATIGKVFYNCSQRGYTSFVDVLEYLDKNKVKEAKFKPLILIDYFEQFGNQQELLSIAKLWDLLKQGDAKSIKRSAVDTYPFLPEIIRRYTTSTRKDGSDAASYTFESGDAVMRCMREYETAVLSANLPDVSMREKISNSVEILGYCDVRTGKEEDRRRLLITEVLPLKNDKGLWAYRLSTKSLGSGKTARLTMYADVYNRKPINEGDIIYASELYKNKKGYWYLTTYSIEV